MAGKNSKWEASYQKFKEDLKDVEKQRGKLDRELKDYHDLLSKISRHVQMLELSSSEEGSLPVQAPTGAEAGSRAEATRLPGTTLIQQIQMSFNLQFVQWQEAMKSEIEAFDEVRQTMKKKHE